MESCFLEKLKSQHVFWFLISLVYLSALIASGHLQGALWEDERNFWKTSLEFSHQLIPPLEQIRNYQELNTPFPFILYGVTEHLFQLGPFAARLFNFITSFFIAFFIGWPGKSNSSKPIFAMLSLFLFPWFLWLSTTLYTDIFASFLGLLGIIFYLRRWHILSGCFMILAISCRQFMLAFPLAIATHEVVIAIRHKRWPSLSFFLPLSASISIFAWFALFGGLVPEAAEQTRNVPELQQSLWAFSIGNGLFFLATIGWAYVIPEFLFFRQDYRWKQMFSFKHAAIFTILLTLFIIYPPYTINLSISSNFVDRIPFTLLNFLIGFGLAFLTCCRFAQVNLAFWLLFFNTLIMTKAVPWDKYALPLLIVLWYLKSHENASIEQWFSTISPSLKLKSAQRQHAHES